MVIHTIGNADFAVYEYGKILVDGTATIKGESITTTGPVVLEDVGVAKASDISGSAYLIGKKRPELLTNINSDGTASIKG
jgi:hypothetical protein